MRGLTLLIAVALYSIAGTIGCIGAMDALGREEAVTETKKNQSINEDDRIEDKHPT